MVGFRLWVIVQGCGVCGEVGCLRFGLWCFRGAVLVGLAGDCFRGFVLFGDFVLFDFWVM